jgi:hypothetical protein
LPRNSDPAEVERRLGAQLEGGRRCVVAGLTARELRFVLDYANAEGLELRDPVGYFLRLEPFLHIGRGAMSDGRKAHRPWCIEVLRPVAAPPGLLVQEWGPNPDGRRIMFGAVALRSGAAYAHLPGIEGTNDERSVGYGT